MSETPRDPEADLRSLKAGRICEAMDKLVGVRPVGDGDPTAENIELTEEEIRAAVVDDIEVTKNPPGFGIISG